MQYILHVEFVCSHLAATAKLPSGEGGGGVYSLVGWFRGNCIGTVYGSHCMEDYLLRLCNLFSTCLGKRIVFTTDLNYVVTSQNQGGVKRISKLTPSHMQVADLCTGRSKSRLWVRAKSMSCIHCASLFNCPSKLCHVMSMHKPRCIVTS